jgi:hypothetical protein
MSAIAAAFVQAQRNFAPALKKADNPYFGTKYADLAVCIEAVIDALHANGIALVQHTDQSEKGVIVSTVFLHESGEHMETGSIFVPAPQNSPQAFGSALTYARRYSLMTACGIAPEDDDGNAASKATPARKPEVKTEPEVDYWTTKFGEVPSYATREEAENNGTATLGSSLQEIASQLGGEMIEEAPQCVHGHRKWATGKKKNGEDWGAFRCTQNNRSTQCDPIWYVFGSNGKWRAQ